MNRKAWMRIAAAIALVACMLSLAACDWITDWFNDAFFNRYDKSEYSALMTQGQEVMEEWVDENMPGGKITDLSAHMYHYLSGPYYLTDYVDATVEYEGETHELTVNTVTGEMYELDYDSALIDAIDRNLPDLLGIEGEVDYEIHNAMLFLPYSHECTSEDADIDGLQVQMLPYGLEDLDAFVTDPANRPLIAVDFEACPAEGVNVDKLSRLESIFALREDCGLYVMYMTVENDEISVDMYNSGALTYGRMGWFDIGDFSVFVYNEEYSQKADSRTGEIETTSTEPFDPARDLVVKETEDGYRFTPSDDTIWLQYRVGAHEGSPVLDSDYHVVIHEDVDVEEDLHWDTTTLDRPVLVDEDGRIFSTPFEIELTRN